MNLYDYTGVIHLHSSFSHDGHAPMARIISAAWKNKIDFLMLTDHDNLKARQEGWEGWQKTTLVIVGEEIAPRFNHYLAFNVNHPVSAAGDPEGKNPQKYINAVNNQGGFGFIAHPDHEGTEMFHVKHYPWNNWDVNGYGGMGVWDFMTDWQKNLNGYFRGLLSFLFPAYFLTGPRPITLERWDALNQGKKTVGIGELDNHASRKKLLGIPFVAFPFDRAFRLICTHVLTRNPFSGESTLDTNTVYQSLLHGRCYFSLEYFHKAKGFQFFIEQEKQEFHMGDYLNLSRQAQLTVSLPEQALVRIIRNGRKWSQKITNHFSEPIEEPGIYRVEAYLKKACKFRPWIFSNPIFVTRNHIVDSPLT
ncbi:MAG: CehA/McbA family metallohydrolase [Deltaproteobacteria bacterium]